jgi:hypothetical protein
MSHEHIELARLQRWMQEVVVHPGTVEEAIGSPAAEREIVSARLEDVVTPSHSLTAAERVGVYHGMYLMRMEEALAADYPVIRYQLGDRQFAHLVREYVQQHPSTSYTLNRLGDRLPQFFLDRPQWPDAALLHDLSRLELALTEVFDERESAILTAADLESVPPEAWESARLRPISAFRLLAFKHAVIPHLTAYHRDRPSPAPRQRASWVAIYRRDYSVLRLELSRAEHDLLRALVDGVSLGEALAAAASTTRGSRQQAKVFRWFRTWIREGLFSAVEVDPAPRGTAAVAAT